MSPETHPQYFNSLGRLNNKYYQEKAMLVLDVSRDRERIEMNRRQCIRRLTELHPETAWMCIRTATPVSALDSLNEYFEKHKNEVDEWLIILQKFEQLRLLYSKEVQKLANERAEIYASKRNSH